MQLFSTVLLASLLTFASAAPSNTLHYAARDIQTTVKLVNNCPKKIYIGQLGDTLVPNNQHVPLSSGRSKTYKFTGKWSGRFWARDNCTGSDCQIAGAASPASLAEFTLKAGGDGNDWYDVSFVDGYNLPMKILPVHPQSTDANNKYWCGAPACKNVPECPSELRSVVDGKYIGCLSACSKFGDPKYCCSGDHSTPDTCPINSYALTVKKSCPDVYTYAYDDASSLYQCRASGYVITWCP